MGADQNWSRELLNNVIGSRALVVYLIRLENGDQDPGSDDGDKKPLRVYPLAFIIFFSKMI